MFSSGFLFHMLTCVRFIDFACGDKRYNNCDWKAYGVPKSVQRTFWNGTVVRFESVRCVPCKRTEYRFSRKKVRKAKKKCYSVPFEVSYRFWYECTIFRMLYDLWTLCAAINGTQKAYRKTYGVPKSVQRTFWNGTVVRFESVRCVPCKRTAYRFSRKKVRKAKKSASPYRLKCCVVFGTSVPFFGRCTENDTHAPHSAPCVIFGTPYVFSHHSLKTHKHIHTRTYTHTTHEKRHTGRMQTDISRACSICRKYPEPYLLAAQRSCTRNE